MLSGDNQRTVNAIAVQAGVDEAHGESLGGYPAGQGEDLVYVEVVPRAELVPRDVLRRSAENEKNVVGQSRNLSG